MNLSYRAARDLEIEQLDVVGAFLASQIKEELYIQFPKGFVRNRDKVVLGYLAADEGEQMPLFARLIHSMYGTRQAALNWFVTFDSELTKLRFTCSKIEAGIYKREDVIILIWVNDIALVGPIEQVNHAKDELKQRFNIKDLGPIKCSTFLGMQVVRDHHKRQIFLCWDAYIERILSRFGMARAHGVHAPISVGHEPARAEPRPLLEHARLEAPLGLKARAG